MRAPGWGRRIVRRVALVALGALAAAGWGGKASASFVTVGTSDANGNYFPFTNIYRGEYQQLYTSAAFSAPVTINSIAFATSVGSIALNETQTLTIGLSTTSATLNTLSSTYAANKGADFTTVYSGTYSLTSLGTGAFDLAFTTTPFVYNPASGNLLLDVVITSGSGSLIPFEATTDAVTSRVYNSGGSGVASVGADSGLVTQFGVSAVPEPGSVTLFVIGGAGVAGMLMRRRSIRRASRTLAA